MTLADALQAGPRAGTVLTVDWLGRGGIAQCSNVWADTVESLGRDSVVVTRAGTELSEAETSVVRVARRRHPVAWHDAVVRAAVREIRARRPTVVVIQNYIIPMAEARVHAAAVEVGARVVFVAHNHRPHGISGTRAGLRRLVRRADLVVTHSNFVAERLADYSGRASFEVVPHPRPPLPEGGTVPIDIGDEELLALHFGAMRRRKQGIDTVAELASRGVAGWRIVVAGAGAPSLPGATTVSGFAAQPDLVALVQRANVVLLPHTSASQSGAVVLAQWLGAVVVTSRVGGLPEQIEDRVTGRLVEPGGPSILWHKTLEELADPDRRTEIAQAARDRVERDHDEFQCRIGEIVA